MAHRMVPAGGGSSSCLFGSVCLSVCPESGRALGTVARLWGGYGGLWLFGPPETRDSGVSFILRSHHGLVMIEPTFLGRRA